MSFVFRQVNSEKDGRPFTYRQQMPKGDGTYQEVVIDLLVRPLLPHIARRLQEPFMKEIGRGARRRRDIPKDRQDDANRAIADYLIAGFGDNAPTVLMKGDKVAFVESAPAYGVPALTDEESVAAEAAGELEEKPWPLTPAGKYLLLSVFPDLESDVHEFASEAVGVDAGPFESSRPSPTNTPSSTASDA